MKPKQGEREILKGTRLNFYGSGISQKNDDCTQMFWKQSVSLIHRGRKSLG